MKKKIEMGEFDTIPSLIGKEVYLRPMAPADAELTHKWFLAADPQSQTCHEIPLRTSAEVAERLKKKERSIERGDFIICDIEDHNAVGKVSYFHLNMLNRTAELGYIVAPEEQKQGYGSEGLKLLIAYLFNELNLNKVYAQTASFNKASTKLLESLDFKLDGTLRQHHYYKGDFYDDLIYSLLKFEANF